MKALAVAALASMALLACCGEDGNPRESFERLVAAIEHGDGGAVCDELAPADRKAWAELGEVNLGRKGVSCEEGFEDFLDAFYPGPKREAAGDVRITGYESSGDSGRVFTDRGDIPYVKVDGDWKALFDTGALMALLGEIE